jgi:hypothetical protein
MPYQPDLRCELLVTSSFLTCLINSRSDYEPVEVDSQILYYVCKACGDGRQREPHNCKTHDSTNAHKAAIEIFDKGPLSSDDDKDRRNSATSGPQIPTHDLLTEDALRALLTSLSAHPHQLPYPAEHPLVYGEPNFPRSPGSPGPSPATGLDWNLYEALEDTQAERSYEDQLREDIAQATLDFLNGDISDLEDGERSDTESSSTDCTSIIFILCGRAYLQN